MGRENKRGRTKESYRHRFTDKKIQKEINENRNNIENR